MSASDQPRQLRTFAPDQETTHWIGCHAEHRDCAAREHARLTSELAAARDRETRLAEDFERRAERAREGMGYTRSGYLTRDSIGLQGMAIAFEAAARALRTAAPAQHGEAGGDA